MSSQSPDTRLELAKDALLKMLSVGYDATEETAKRAVTVSEALHDHHDAMNLDKLRAARLLMHNELAKEIHSSVVKTLERTPDVGGSDNWRVEVGGYAFDGSREEGSDTLESRIHVINNARNMTIRFDLTFENKDEGSGQVVTNVHHNHKDANWVNLSGIRVLRSSEHAHLLGHSWTAPWVAKILRAVNVGMREHFEDRPFPG